MEKWNIHFHFQVFLSTKQLSKHMTWNKSFIKINNFFTLQNKVSHHFRSIEMQKINAVRKWNVPDVIANITQNFHTKINFINIIHFLYRFYYFKNSRLECFEIHFFIFIYLFTSPVMKEHLRTARWRRERGRNSTKRGEGKERALMQLLERVLRI